MSRWERRLHHAAARVGLVKARIPRPQLTMRWPAGEMPRPVATPPPEYRLRQFGAGDATGHARLMLAAEMGEFPLAYWLDRVLPDGFFVVEHLSSQSLAAACMASHAPAPRYPFGGNLGWLATDPAHRGQGLGSVVATSVTDRLVRGGYHHIYLTTDDERLPAILLYLRMGWFPDLAEAGMTERWRKIVGALGWPFTPESWTTDSLPSRP